VEAAEDTATAREARRGIERDGRRARRFHTATYLLTLALLLTGWWIALGGEGNPSPLARAFGVGDVTLHVWAGRALALLALVPLILGRRGIATFLRETFRRDPGDARWWARWPLGALAGRFGRHEGRFDPGQRIANVVLVGGLLVLTISGLWLTTVHGGPTFVWLNRVHTWTALVLTFAIAGHLVVALGVLPGYRGVWRAMHLRGRVPETTARRIWPGWTERELRAATTGSSPPADPSEKEPAAPGARPGPRRGRP
jgi:cytochrome b subunit of formate dehydrogenase